MPLNWLLNCVNWLFSCFILFGLAQGQLQALVGDPSADVNLDASLSIHLEPDFALSADGALISNWKNLAAPTADAFHSFEGSGTSLPTFIKKSDGAPWIALEVARNQSFRMSMAGDFDDYLTFSEFTLHISLYTIFRAFNATLFEIEGAFFF